MFWISSYRKHCARHQLANMDSDIKKLLKPEHVSQFRASKPALAAVRILGTSSDNTHVTTQTEFVIVHDFLLTEIAVGNANRSGVLANMTMNEFLQARLVDGQYVVSVADHKTAYSYGPAKIVLTPTLHSWIDLYAQKLRPSIITTEAAPEQLFLSWNGEALTSGQITRAVQSIWNKAGLNEHITLNLVRKTAVSTMHEKRPQMSSQLADLMCHGQKSPYGKIVSPQMKETTAVPGSYCRVQKCCPVCRVPVIHIPRHLRNSHGWTSEEARAAVQRFKLRRVPEVKRKQKYKDYHKLRPCPVPGCSVSVKRLPSHLQSHKIAKNSLQYKMLLYKAKKSSKYFKHAAAEAAPSSVPVTQAAVALNTPQRDSV